MSNLEPPVVADLSHIDRGRSDREPSLLDIAAMEIILPSPHSITAQIAPDCSIYLALFGSLIEKSVLVSGKVQRYSYIFLSASR